MSKYLALQKYLEAQNPGLSISLTLAEIDAIVGGLPNSASKFRPWWANTYSTQGKGWMNAGRRVDTVNMGEDVIFSEVGRSDPMELIVGKSSTKLRRRSAARNFAKQEISDGVIALEKLILEAGYSSIVEVVSANTYFLHPDTVAQTEGKAVFPVVRNQSGRGKFNLELKVYYGDNTIPSWLFIKSSQRKKGRDIQFNHVWSDSKNVDVYSALWNLCVTPAFLAKTTDGKIHPEVTQALKYRSFQLYGYLPVGVETPQMPKGYENLIWPESPPPVDNLELILREALQSAPESAAAKCARKLGWLFSGGKPDPTI